MRPSYSGANLDMAHDRPSPGHIEIGAILPILSYRIRLASSSHRHHQPHLACSFCLVSLCVAHTLPVYVIMHLHRLLSAWLIPAIILAQRIFIDELPGYKALPSCAERPVHTIVKDMSMGCGDRQKTTSYSCFCTASSTQYVSIISKEVAKLCLPDTTTAVPQALSLFESYCAIGSAKNGTAVLSKTLSSSVTTAATTTSSSPSASPTASPGAASTRPTLPASPSETGSSGGARSRSYSQTVGFVLLGIGMVLVS
ncbi:hypothetical protein PG988_001904 [Apiospora saccharicola]